MASASSAAHLEDHELSQKSIIVNLGLTLHPLLDLRHASPQSHLIASDIDNSGCCRLVFRYERARDFGGQGEYKAGDPKTECWDRAA